MLASGPVRAFPLRTRGRMYWHPEQISRAAENIGCSILRDLQRRHTWYLPPTSKLDALRLLDSHARGELDWLHATARRRVIDDACAVANMGQCHTCQLFMPLAELYEDGAGWGCDPCSMADQ